MILRHRKGGLASETGVVALETGGVYEQEGVLLSYAVSLLE